MGIIENEKNYAEELWKKRLGNLKRDVRAIFSGNNLTRLAQIYGADKWGKHFYTPHYQNHFRRMKNKDIRLLEIGVGGDANPYYGAQSLRMWKRYFSKGEIYGIDINDKSFFNERRIKIFRGNQIDSSFLRAVVAEAGNFDIIIDDGSHRNEHVIETLKILFPALKEGGIYVVEDTQTSYWPEFGGDSRNLDNPNTMLNFFKRFADCINHKERIWPGYVPAYFDENIISLHFYHNLVFIDKGKNTEGSHRVRDNQLQPVSYRNPC